jgi:hypothetical protein
MSHQYPLRLSDKNYRWLVARSQELSDPPKRVSINSIINSAIDALRQYVAQSKEEES